MYLGELTRDPFIIYMLKQCDYHWLSLTHFLLSNNWAFLSTGVNTSGTEIQQNLPMHNIMVVFVSQNLLQESIATVHLWATSNFWIRSSLIKTESVAYRIMHKSQTLFCTICRGFLPQLDVDFLFKWSGFWFIYSTPSRMSNG